MKLEKENLVRERKYEEEDFEIVSISEMEWYRNRGSHHGRYDHDINRKNVQKIGDPSGIPKFYCTVCSKTWR